MPLERSGPPVHPFGIGSESMQQYRELQRIIRIASQQHVAQTDSRAWRQATAIELSTSTRIRFPERVEEEQSQFSRIDTTH